MVLFATTQGRLPHDAYRTDHARLPSLKLEGLEDAEHNVKTSTGPTPKDNEHSLQIVANCVWVMLATSTLRLAT